MAAVASSGRRAVPLEHAWDDEYELDAAVGEERIDACIHLGWYADPIDYLVDVPGNLRSLRSSCTLVTWLGRRDVRRLVAVGSGAEYGISDAPHDEDECAAPWSVYGAAKAAFRQLLLSSMRPPGMAVAWGRVFNVTGPGEDPNRLIPWVIRSLLAGEPVQLSPGEQQRDFLDVDDVASALVALAVAGVDGTLNICSGRGVTLKELLSGIGRRLGRQDLLGFGARAYGPHDAPVVTGRAGRLREATGWTPAHDMDAMIERVIAYWSESMGGPS